MGNEIFRKNEFTPLGEFVQPEEKQSSGPGITLHIPASQDQESPDGPFALV